MSSSRPQSRDRRTKSAIARLTPPEPEKPKQSHQLGAKEREKRVKSASLNREKNQSSKKVFPRPSSGDKKERYRTIYNKDFEGTYISPVEPRPTSPTRRNNPHPTQVSTLSVTINTNYVFVIYSNLWYGEYLHVK